ncbi:MAG TPA: selenium cofactor biosynthesis protein YqeC [Anaerolineae bacterium]|nr:selenium cofactor biosynthesis protein YqeC [Anaerolineae bacterium]
MKLTTVLRMASTPRVAIVGGGGKTTTMFTLAREYTSPVIVAATAHMAIEQLALANQHFFVNTPGDVIAHLPSGITFFSGSENSTGKTVGLTPETARAVKELADRHGAPFFIEADGSKCLPLKAPAEHEPPIPEFVDVVIYVVGLSGLGQPLDTEHVHRPDRFARLSGLALGDAVTPDSIAKVLSDPIGGLKNMPPSARRIAVLNQADTAELQAQAQLIARQLLPTYHSVAITALKYQQIFAVHEPTAGVILAAGASTRMGQPKPLLLWRGEPFIRHVVRTALNASLSPVVIVAGEHTAEIRAAVSDLRVTVIHNPAWEAGQSTSVKCGLRSLPNTIGSAVFLLADQPHIPIELVKALRDQHAQTLSPIVAPLIDERRGNPVLFDRVTFSDLQSLTGDVGGRAVFAKHPIAYVPWHDASLLLDVDTPEDYRRLLESTQAGADEQENRF